MADKYNEYWNSRTWRINPDDAKRVDHYALKSFLSEIKPQKLLEIGCGPGRFLPLYHDIPHVTATDLVQNRLDICKELPFKFNDFNLKCLDISTECLIELFDVIVSSQVILHIPPKSIKMAIQNMYNMTEPNGYWWHCTYYEPDKLSGIDEDYGDIHKTRNSFSYPLPELFQDAGMTIVSMENVKFSNDAINTIFICKKEV